MVSDERERERERDKSKRKEMSMLEMGDGISVRILLKFNKLLNIIKYIIQKKY
jgi:hypothetical protein